MERQAGSLDPRTWKPGMVCSICGEFIRRHQGFNLDHEIPISRGGRRGKINKRIVHVICNAVKGSRYPFSLRTAEERAAVRSLVQDKTFRRLAMVWAGGTG